MEFFLVSFLVKKKNTSFSFIVTHVYEASVHSSVPQILGNAT